MIRANAEDQNDIQCGTTVMHVCRTVPPPKFGLMLTEAPLSSGFKYAELEMSSYFLLPFYYLF